MDPINYHTCEKQIALIQEFVENSNKQKTENDLGAWVSMDFENPTPASWPCISNLAYSITQLGKTFRIKFDTPKKDMPVNLFPRNGPNMFLHSDRSEQDLQWSFWFHCCEQHGPVFIDTINEIAKKTICADAQQRALKERFLWLQQRVNDYCLPEDQCQLGCCFSRGWGTERSSETAFTWFQKAAEQGFPEAQSELGVCYQNGAGVAQSSKQAFSYFQKAASFGVKTAQECLGFSYRLGCGVPQAPEIAKEWFEKAMAQENASNGIFILIPKTMEKL